VIDEQPDEPALSEHERVVESHVHGSVWQLQVQPGDRVEVGQTLLVLESMKMEIALHAEHNGTVARLLCRAGSQVAPGQALMVIDLASESPSATETAS
jgi:urea carboxylase